MELEDRTDGLSECNTDLANCTRETVISNRRDTIIGNLFPKGKIGSIAQDFNAFDGEQTVVCNSNLSNLLQ